MRTGTPLVSQGLHAPFVHDEESVLSIVERDGAILYTVSIDTSPCTDAQFADRSIAMDDWRKLQETRFTTDAIITTISTS